MFSQFAEYFTIENSIKEMKVLVRVLFSIAIRDVNIPIKGQWDVDNVASDATSLLLVGDNNGGGGGLRKFIFHHKVDGIIEAMYFYLHPHEGKLCVTRSISLLSLFSNYSSTAGDGGGGTKLLYIMEEEFCKDEDGWGDTCCIQERGCNRGGIGHETNYIAIQRGETGSVLVGCNHMPSTARVPLCVDNVHHDCIINKDLMVVIMTVAKEDQDNVNVICITMRDCNKKDNKQGDHLSVVITRDAATNNRGGNNGIPSTLNLLSNIDEMRQRKNRQSAQARVQSMRCFKGGLLLGMGLRRKVISKSPTGASNDNIKGKGGMTTINLDKRREVISSPVNVQVSAEQVFMKSSKMGKEAAIEPREKAPIKKLTPFITTKRDHWIHKIEGCSSERRVHSLSFVKNHIMGLMKITKRDHPVGIAGTGIATNDKPDVTNTNMMLIWKQL